MDFKSIEEIQHAFVNGGVDITQDIVINGIIFKKLSEEFPNISEMVINPKRKGYIVYSAGQHKRQEASDRGLQEWIVMVWRVNDSLAVLPYMLKNIPKTQAVNKVSEGVGDENELSDTTVVKVLSIPSSRKMDAVVDTGATICSMHADSVKYSPEDRKVTFRCPYLSDTIMTMELSDEMTVNTPDGKGEKRPVIKLDIEINGKHLGDILVNLNDRSHMSTPFLVGMNALKAGEFVIRPTLEQYLED